MMNEFEVAIWSIVNNEANLLYASPPEILDKLMMTAL